MNGLLRLWKTNLVVVVLQILVGTGLWFILPANPEKTFLEQLGSILFLLSLLTLLFGVLSAYGTLTTNPPVLEPITVSVASGLLLGVSVGIGWFWMFCVEIINNPSFHFSEWGWREWGSFWFGPGIPAVFVSLAYGAMGILCLAGAIFSSGKDDSAPAPVWVRAITALPFGIGVLGGGALLLLRKLLSSR